MTDSQVAEIVQALSCNNIDAGAWLARLTALQTLTLGVLLCGLLMLCARWGFRR